MQKRALIIAGSALILLVLIGGIVLFLFLKKQEVPEATNTEQPFSTTGSSVSGATAQKRTIYTRSGATMTVADFTQGKPVQQIGQTPDDTQYELTPYPEYSLTTPYIEHEFDVAFNQKTSEFIVVLNQEPLGHARLAAEAFLTRTLGVTPKDLCGLNITITTPFSVNEVYGSYNNLGPSQCEGAVTLP